MTQNTLPAIVLVEDDEIDTEFVKSSLKKHQLKNPFLHAKDGVNAMEILTRPEFQKQSQKPCVILLDINLPRMNGLQLLDKIRQTPDLKESIVYILTTSTLDKDILKAYNHNIAGYILKDQADELFKMLSNFFAINQFAEAI